MKRTVNKDGSTEALEHISDRTAPCHFLHKVSYNGCDDDDDDDDEDDDANDDDFQDESSVAALSLCSGRDVHGLVFSADRWLFL